MQIVISGATGFVGQALVRRLERDSHHIKALSRNPDRAREALGSAVETVDLNDDNALRKAIDGADVVVNLAGENVSGGRWTQARKKRLWDSRVVVTERIVSAMEESQMTPSVLISASAVGIYGDTGDAVASESTNSSTDFLARLCVGWEAAAVRAEDLGVRVVRVRMGVVMGRGGGALKFLLPLFSKGLGGPLGNGQQWMSWIHLEDLVQVMMAALHDERFRGAVNAVAPDSVRNGRFSEELAASVGSTARMAVPGVLLRLGMGHASSMLLNSSRVDDKTLRAMDFEFLYPTLRSALREITDSEVSERGQSPSASKSADSVPNLRASVGLPVKE
jgi:uncharacterized protein (TIGR01777 family)